MEGLEAPGSGKREEGKTDNFASVIGPDQPPVMTCVPPHGWWRVGVCHLCAEVRCKEGLRRLPGRLHPLQWETLRLAGGHPA